MNLFDLAAKLTLDSSEYEKGLKDAEEKGSNFGSKIKSAMKVGGAAVTAFGAAAGALAGTFVSGANDVAEYGDAIDKNSQKMGISAQAYQEWDAILQHSGSSIDSMSKGMITLQKKAEAGADAFEALGISQEDVANMSTEDLFSATISALQEMEEGSERTALASELFGGAAKELGPLLNTSAEETEAMRQKVHELGGVMSDDAVKAAAEYQDSLQDMQTAFGGVKRGLMSDFMPALTTVMDGLTAIFSGDSGGVEMITEGINQFVSTISESIPDLMETGSQIILALVDAISQNLPTLLTSAGDAIMTIGEGLIQNLPTIIESGLQVILSLATGIAENLPTLIPTIVEVVIQIVETLVDNVDLMVDSAIALIMGLTEGIINAVPILLEKAPEIIMKLVAAIIRNAPKMFESSREIVQKLGEGISNTISQLLSKGRDMVSKIGDGIKQMASTVLGWGREVVSKVASAISGAISSLVSAGMNIVQGIWQGISNGFGWITSRISGWVGNVISYLKRLLKIGSPSKVMADEVGQWMAKGIGVGFVNEMSNVEKLMEDAIPEADDFNASFGVSTARASRQRSRTDSEIIRLLNAILENMDTDLVLDDGTLVGWMDKALGRRATQKARGNA